MRRTGDTPLGKKRMHLMLTERQHKKMSEMAEKTGYSISELLRRAVDLFLAQTKKSDE